MNAENNQPTIFSEEVDNSFRKILHQRDEEFAAMTKRMSDEGYNLVVSCMACPVQLHGYLPSTEPFYFRSRYDTARLEIGKQNSKPFDEVSDTLEWKEDISFEWVVWSHEKQVGNEMFEASWIDAETTGKTLKKLYQCYQNGFPSIDCETIDQFRTNQVNKVNQLFPLGD